MKRISYMIRKEFIQLFRSRPMIAITFGMPLIQLVILGFAISGDVVHVPAAIADLDNSPLSRSLVEKLTNTRYLDVRYRPQSIQSVRHHLQQDDAIIGITIPEQFERDLIRGQMPSISLIADAQNTNVALTGAGYVNRIVLSWGVDTLARERPLMKPHIISVECRIWYNPELKNSSFMVTGIISLLVTIITVLLTGLAIVRERGDKNTLEQLIVTPISRLELILGKTIPFGIMGLIELTLALIVAKLVYDIPIAGSLPEFYAMSIVFMFSTLGLGIFVSTVANTQQQALFAAWFIMVFCMLMSGFFLPLENMPYAIYLLTYIDPLRYYMTIVRELFLKGSGFAVLWPQVAALAGIAVVVLTLAVSRFQKRLG